MHTFAYSNDYVVIFTLYYEATRSVKKVFSKIRSNKTKHNWPAGRSTIDTILKPRLHNWVIFEEVDYVKHAVKSKKNIPSVAESVHADCSSKSFHTN